MASLTQWTWVWVNSSSWWWTGRPGVLQSTGLQRVGHDWVTERNWCKYSLVSHWLWLDHMPFLNQSLWQCPEEPDLKYKPLTGLKKVDREMAADPRGKLLFCYSGDVPIGACCPGTQYVEASLNMQIFLLLLFMLCKQQRIWNQQTDVFSPDSLWLSSVIVKWGVLSWGLNEIL